ncbi:MAG TPA: phosphotransferase [Mycobacteriales bacterium]|nr:phosphotransferase [Mycobacteriales bacterium]
MTHLTPHRSAELRRALATICRAAGVPDTGAELIRYTNHAVYRLPRAHVVARIADGPLAAERAARVVATARWLAVRGAPVVPLAAGIRQPVRVGRVAATFWRELATINGTAADLAKPLLALHGLTGIGLPRWTPFGIAARRLAAADELTPEDHAWLGAAWAAASREYDAVAPTLRSGVVHGDAHVGNLLRERAGQVVLCDLDSTGFGPLEWDLVPAAVAAIRFDGSAGYAELVQAYGRDVTQSPAWPLLRRIRELTMVTVVLPDLRQRPAIAAEHAHRMRTLRAGDDDAGWRRYE